MSVAVMYKGELIYAEGFGKRNEHQPFTKEVAYPRPSFIHFSVIVLSEREDAKVLTASIAFFLCAFETNIDDLTDRIVDKGVHVYSYRRAGC
jgi:hypothetical protein